MSRHTINLPSRSFKSKAEATAYFREMINRYKNGEDIAPDDEAILFELLQRHPEAEEKIGVGVKLFFRDKSPIHPSSCFHVERIDGTTTDFSFISCISGSTASLSQQFYEACRYAISERLIHQKHKLFAEAGGIMRCSKTGVLIDIHEAEYRHTTPTFREIIKSFVETYNIIISPSMITHGSDLQYVTRLADLNIEKLFKDYHSSNSNLAMFKKYEIKL